MGAEEEKTTGGKYEELLNKIAIGSMTEKDS